MDIEVPLHVLPHLRDSSRLNAQTLRRLAVDAADAHSAWLEKRANEIDHFADELDRYITDLEEHG
jgi:hypothetical protein